MKMRSFWGHCVCFAAILVGASRAEAGSLTYSHTASALPNAAGPAITLESITGATVGANYTFTLKFFNPTIEGPSSNNSDAVYGFINLDTDNNKATGLSGSDLDSRSYETGFGRFTPSSLGIDAFISLSSEGLPFVHTGPGMVDLVTTNGFGTVATVPVTYTNSMGGAQSTLSISIPLSTFANGQLNLVDTGNFSVVVGNANNPTDFLGPLASAVPEPGSLVLLGLGISLPLVIRSRLKRRTRAR
jgi:PEP-CTERM motif